MANPKPLYGDWHLTDADRALNEAAKAGEDVSPTPGGGPPPEDLLGAETVTADSRKAVLEFKARELGLDDSGTREEIYDRIQAKISAGGDEPPGGTTVVTN